MASLENIKTKYAAALQEMKDNGVELSHLNMDSGKLYIQGTAPSEEAKNAVWDVVKSIDPSYSDLTLDLSIDDRVPQDLSVDSDPTPPLPPVPQDPGPTSYSAAPSDTYVVQSGDTLSKIAKQLYGDPSQYTKIFDANRDVLESPNLIRAGQVLKIP